MTDRSDGRVCAAPDCDERFTPNNARHRYHAPNCRTRAWRQRQIEEVLDEIREILNRHFGKGQ